MAASPSPTRQLANAANALHSTGPRTAPGKARSSQNARTHGLTAKRLLVADEDREQFRQFEAAFRADIHPQGALQETLFQELILAAWNLRRIERMEAAIFVQESDPLAFALNEKLFGKLDRLTTLRGRTHNAYLRSLRELRALQTSAALAATLPPEIVGIMQPLASAPQLAKRTQEITRSAPGRPSSRVFRDSDLADIALRAARASQRLAAQPTQPGSNLPPNRPLSN